MDKQLVVWSRKTPPFFERLLLTLFFTQNVSVQGDGKDDAFVQEKNKLDKDKLDNNVNNFNNPLIQFQMLQAQYNNIFLVNNNKFLGMLNPIKDSEPQMVIKIFFISISNWKLYVHLLYDMHYCLTATSKHNPNHFCLTIFLQIGHICVGIDALHILKVEEVITDTLLPNLNSEPKLQTRLS